MDELDWPARAYCYGTFGYALAEATARALKHRLKMFVYRGFLNGEPVWVVDWDGKKCLCPHTDPSTWLSAASCGYGSGYEPGSMQEWNPECPIHRR